jgi:signal transduction histidine kinase
MTAEFVQWITLTVVLIAGGAAFYLIVSERRRDEEVKRENARLLAEAVEREAERSRLADKIITAEQDERRRLALFLHDGPVQNLSGIALMLDAAVHAIEDERGPDALGIVGKALEKHRETIRSLRDLSFNIEPVVLREQGLGAAVRELANQLGIEHEVQIEVDVERAERLGQKEQVGLYQIIRESLNQALLRGPPTRISVAASDARDGGLEVVIADNGKGERRLRALDAIEERVATLNGRFSAEQGADGGTTLHVLLPAYTNGRGEAAGSR